MQIERRKRLKISHDDEDTNPYPFWINFYTNPPSYKVTLQEIEEMVGERLRVLQVIDNLMKSLESGKRTKQFYEVLASQLNTVKGSNNEKNFYVSGRSTEISSKVFDARKRDHISHFLLRIYYCQTEELRKWFISRETELFRVKFISSSLSNSAMLEDCLSYYGYKYELVSTEERVDFHNKINWIEANKTNLSSMAFKLKFEDALDLIRARKVYLSDGFAYIGANEMITVICSQFRLNLSREMTKMHTSFYSIGEQRLVSRLDSLHNQFIATGMKKTDKSQNDGNKFRVSSDMVDQLALDIFPPCMRAIHENLRKDHHLKHYGRLYYGLFLKAIGMPMDEAIDFFRSEFSITNPDKFQKEYSYTIRYIYGKEGKRVQLSAYSCQKIINENAPGPTDSHGCPFRHYDMNNLKATLVRYGISEQSTLDDIINMVKTDKNYNGACAKFFSVKLASTPHESFTIFHPNQFYSEARRVLYAPVVTPQGDTPCHLGDTSIDDLNVTISGDTTIDSLHDQTVHEDDIDTNALNETV